MRSILTGFIDAVFPPNCILCRQYHPNTRTNPVCPSCIQTLPFNTPPFCLKCSRHLPHANPDGICPSCREHPPSFDMALGMIRYESSAKDLLHRFKFHDKTSLRHTFENIFRVFFKKHSILFPKNSLLIPIPLHPVRLRERGYDQALLLTNAISSITQLPVCPVLERIRNTPHQTSLKQKERFTNINGAFKMKPLSTVQNTNIILVDDLLTTGATVNEASRVLKSAGANSINVLTLAIT